MATKRKMLIQFYEIDTIEFIDDMVLAKGTGCIDGHQGEQYFAIYLNPRDIKTMQSECVNFLS